MSEETTTEEIKKPKVNVEPVQNTTESSKSESTHDSSAHNSDDVEKNKTIAALSYLVFFLPLLVAPDSKFGKFHANQGLLLLILYVAVNLFGTLIPILGWFIVLPFGNIFAFVLLIMGILNATSGKTIRLPLIGSYDIIK